jgi:type II secretory pathway pseudopilin PulG
MTRLSPIMPASAVGASAPGRRLRELRARRGEGLASALFGLVILGVGMAAVSPLVVERYEDIRDKAVADQMSDVLDATEAYARANIAAIKAAIPNPGDLSEIPFTDLTTDGRYLSAGMSSTNAFAQGYRILARRVSAEAVSVIVVAEGAVQPPLDEVGKIAALVGGRGGAVNVSDTSQAVGAQGAWTLDTADYAGLWTANPGELVGMAYHGQGLDADGCVDCLYRNDVGDPTRNTMFVDLNMGGKTITNANDVQITGKRDGYGFSTYMSEGVHEAMIRFSGNEVRKPTCPGLSGPGTGVPQIFVSIGNLSDTGAGRPVVGMRTYAIDNNQPLPTIAYGPGVPAQGTVRLPVGTNTDGPGTWTVAMTVLTEDATGTGLLETPLPGNYGSMTVFTKCVR